MTNRPFTSSSRIGNPHYDPVNLLETLQRVFLVKNDRQLAARLDVSAPLLCRIRHNKVDVPAWLLIYLTDETHFTLREIRALMGDYRANTGPSAKHPTRDELSAMRTVRVEMVPRQTVMVPQL